MNFNPFLESSPNTQPTFVPSLYVLHNDVHLVVISAACSVCVYSMCVLCRFFLEQLGYEALVLVYTQTNATSSNAVESSLLAHIEY